MAARSQIAGRDATCACTLATAGLGQLATAPLPRLSDRYSWVKVTFAGSPVATVSRRYRPFRCPQSNRQVRPERVIRLHVRIAAVIARSGHWLTLLDHLVGTGED